MRFRKSVKIMPGVRLNFSKSGVSTSIGRRGATVNVSKRGIRSTLSIPGTGLSWSRKNGWTEGGVAEPSVEIEALCDSASKALEKISKDAEKANAAIARIDRAILTLSGGRGLTQSKAQTFEKRVHAEDRKMCVIADSMREQVMFLEAINERLLQMKFGLFGGGAKRLRDGASGAVSRSTKAARDIERQLSDAKGAVAEKLSEVHARLESKIDS